MAPGAFKIAHELASFESVPELLSGALEILRREMRYEFWATLFGGGKGASCGRGHSDLLGPRYVVGQRIPWGQGIVGWVARERRPARVGNVLTDPTTFPSIQTSVLSSPSPSFFGTELLGVLDVESVEPERFRP